MRAHPCGVQAYRLLRDARLRAGLPERAPVVDVLRVADVLAHRGRLDEMRAQRVRVGSLGVLAAAVLAHPGGQTVGRLGHAQRMARSAQVGVTRLDLCIALRVVAMARHAAAPGGV